MRTNERITMTSLLLLLAVAAAARGDDWPNCTHPHPAFSPDRSRVVFTSDTSGVAQLYEVTLR